MILGSQTVTVLHGAGRDNFGDRTGADTSTTITGCSVQPGSSTEQTAQGDLVASTLTVFLPAGTDVVVTDRISYGGTVYQVDGDPQRWTDQGAVESHVEAIVKLVKGSD